MDAETPLPPSKVLLVDDEAQIVGGRPVERLRLAPECINTERCRHKGGGTVQLGLSR